MKKTTKTTRTEKKEQALACLKRLQVAKLYIEDFEQSDKVYGRRRDPAWYEL